MGLPIAALGVWYAFARGRATRRGRRSPLARCGLDVRRHLRRRAALRRARQPLLRLLRRRRRFAGGCRPEALHGSRRRCSARSSRRTTSPTSSGSALPLLFLFLLSPGLAAVALPQLLANGLSDFRSMTDPRYHSVAAVIPFLIAATVLGIAADRAPRRPLAAAAVLVCSATLAVFVGPWARAVGGTPLGGRRLSLTPSAVAALNAAIALVPTEAPVTASNSAGAHLSARRYVYSVPVLGRAEWVVIDRERSVGGPSGLADPDEASRRSCGALVARLERDAALAEGLRARRRLRLPPPGRAD